MLCDICHNNEATIHIKEIVGGEKKSLNLCSSCAAEHEKTAGINFGSFNLAEMLFNLEKLSGAAAPAAAAAPQQPSPVCPGCGWTLQKIRESGGRLGCPRCYETFAGPIREALENVHRGQMHLGKRLDGGAPDGTVQLRAELARCRYELTELVKCENYEQAAKVRDRIREIEARLNAPGKEETHGQ